MSQSELEEAYSLFWEDLLYEAEAAAEPQSRAFFQIYAGLAAENGDSTDLQYTPVVKEGRGGYQIDGFALEAERGDLYLAISDFRSERELQSLSAAQIDSFFARVQHFCELAIQPTFINDLEETSPAFEAAWPIYSQRALIRRVRAIMFSNARLSARRKPEAAGQVLGVPFVCSVLDFSRYVGILKAHGGAEPVEIDLVALNGVPIPCLPAHAKGGGYEAYLIAMPGELLAEIYGLYGARLLEQNVRTFLQARTKVNAGIITTLETTPEMFFAYNNGLTATASGITTKPLPGGGLGICNIENLQIVNGGQTTASILYAKDQRKADLSGTFVQVKLSVINPERLEEIVPKISRYANTQNKINEADFFSNHPFHVVLEKISRRLSAPAKPGTLSGSKWFYERARGQYRDQQAYGTPAARRRFEVEFPRDQVIEKTDLAKFETTFDCRPHTVSRGAQKCFLDFAEAIGEAWTTAETSFNDYWFRNAVAKAIVFRWTDHMIGLADWYKNDRGYKAQIVTYTIAWLVNMLRVKRNEELNLDVIWQRQDVAEEIAITLRELAPQIAMTLKDAPPNMKNVSEYCKQQACWAVVAASDHAFTDNFRGLTLDRNLAKEARKDAAAIGKIDREIDFDHVLVQLAGKVEPVLVFARAKRLLSPKSDGALRRLARNDLRLSASERDALKFLLKRSRELGFELADHPPPSPSYSVRGDDDGTPVEEDIADERLCRATGGAEAS